MSFESEKEKALNTLKKFDRSDKGSVDKPIKKLIDYVNSLKDYYTTSSCSGRIICIKIPDNGLKKDADFLFRTHDFADFNSMKEILSCDSGTVWFRQEPAILHLAARTLEDASKFLKIARPIGFKRGGLFELEKRFLIEIVSTERIDALIVKDGKVLVSEEYLKVLIEEANKRLKKTWDKTDKLLKEIQLL